MRHNFWCHFDASKSDCGLQIAKIHVFYVQNRGFIEPFKKHDFLRYEGRSHFQMHRNAIKSYGAQYLNLSNFGNIV